MEKRILTVIDFRVWANHGWYEEERKLGAEYRIDVDMRLRSDQRIDDINQTVNYELVCQEIKRVMSQTFKLIEETTEALCAAIIALSQNLVKVEVKLTKLNVPINGLAATSFTLAVEID